MKLSEEEIETIAAKWVDTLLLVHKEGKFEGMNNITKRSSYINLFVAFYEDVRKEEKKGDSDGMEH